MWFHDLMERHWQAILMSAEVTRYGSQLINDPVILTDQVNVFMPLVCMLNQTPPPPMSKSPAKKKSKAKIVPKDVLPHFLNS